VRLLRFGWDALVLLVLAAILLAGAVLEAGSSPWRSNVLIVGTLSSAFAALGLIFLRRGFRPGSLPMVGIGVLLIPLGLLFSYWTYGDSMASVLGLEHPLRMARMVVHSGYSLIIAGLFLAAYTRFQGKSLGEGAARETAIEQQDRGEAVSPMEFPSYFFRLKAVLIAAVVLLAVISVTTWVGIF
jgi:hypothetical protein